MSDYFEEVRPTYLENWPQALRDLSIPQVDVPLSLDDARAIGLNIIELGDGFKQLVAGGYGCYTTAPDLVLPPPDISGIVSRVRQAAAKFPGGAFVRLGSRSPKDSYLGYRTGFRVFADDEQPLRFMLDCSERIADDLRLAIAENYPPHIFVREWVEMPAWSEFRCFMRDRKLVGISQYQYRDEFPELHDRHHGIATTIDQFFPVFSAACHLDSVVFDVFLRCHQSQGVDWWEARLLEINPFSEFTDPCLFDWSKPDEFDGSLRLAPPGTAAKKAANDKAFEEVWGDADE